MISFELTPEQQELVQLAREIALEKFAPTAMTWATSDEAPIENLNILRKAGLLGISVPEEYGGAGLTAFDSLLVVEALGSVCPATAALMNVFDLGPASVLNHHGSEEQKQRYLPRMMAGEEWPVIALTEPEAGTQLTALRTSARIEDDTCIINGSKVFCSNADTATLFFVYVRFGPENSDIGAVMVERDTPGFTVGPVERHMSGQPWCELYFDEARVPVANILPLKNGFKDLIATYSMERLGAAAKCIGIAETARTLAQKHVNERVQFGHTLWEFQGVQWKFADMEMQLAAARLLMYRAASKAENDRPSRMESSIAKVAAAEAACFVTDESIQVCGATGMDVSTGMPWLYALARAYRLAGGASEVHRDMIAKDQLAQSWTYNGRAAVSHL